MNPHLPGRSLSAFIALALVLVSPPTRAQRDEARIQWQKRQVVIEYGVVPVGKHSVDDLKIGTTWRMGRNTASTLRTQMPILAGESVIAPGAYRVNVVRRGSDAFGLGIDGGAFGIDPLAQKAVAIELPGRLMEARKRARKLRVVITPDTTTSDPNLRATVRIHFGEHTLQMPIEVLETRTRKNRAWALDGYAVPVALLEKRLADGLLTPVATLRRISGRGKGEAWNLLLGEKEAVLSPQLSAPTEFFGFGAVKRPDPDRIVRPKVTWSPSQEKRNFVKLQAFVAKKGVITVTLLCGQRSCALAGVTPTPARSNK